MRALLCGCLCNCNHSIRGADDDPQERIRQFVAIRAYDVAYAAVYGDGEGPDEEFGLEPY